MRKGSMAVTNANSDEAQIRSLLDARVKAVRAKDVEGATGSISAEWIIAHEHNSVPLDVGTGKASLGL
jgi:hypothetical protein